MKKFKKVNNIIFYEENHVLSTSERLYIGIAVALLVIVALCLVGMTYLYLSI